MSNGYAYALSLNDLLQVLRGSAGQSYRVQAEVPASLLPSSLKRGTFLAEALVIGGQMDSCVIGDQTGKIHLEGSAAFEAVRSLEMLIWSVFPWTQPERLALAQTSSLPAAGSPWTRPMTLPALSVPWSNRPAPVKLPAMQLLGAQLPNRQLRQLWLLIDGRRHVADLAMLLKMSLSDVSNALTRLEEGGLITSGPSLPEGR